MAGGTNVGSLNATLTLSAWEFQNGLTESAAAALEFADQTEVAAKKGNAAISKVGGGMNAGGAARAVQQIGFGIQDFASQFETRGLAGGISAVSNNVQMLGAAFGPVGLAISAFGGAIAGIVLPKLIESSGMFTNHKKAIDENASALTRWRKEITEAAKAEQDLLNHGVQSLNQKQAERRAELTELSKQKAILEKGNAVDKTAMDDANKAIIALGEQYGMLVGWLGSGTITDNGATDRVAARNKEIKEIEKEQAEISKAMANAEKSRSKVDKADQAREDTDQWFAKKEFEAKGQEAINQLRIKGLEQYGSEYSKVIERQKREAKELADMTMGLRDAESAKKLQADMHAIELQRVIIAEREKYISQLGPDAKMSAGLDVASSEGISAINRWMNGKGENDIQREQLAIEKKQLVAMEAMAHGSDEDREMRQAAMDAAGKEMTMDVGGEPIGSNFDGKTADIENARAKNPAMYDMLDAKRAGRGSNADEMAAIANESRNKAAARSQQTWQKIEELRADKQAQLEKARAENQAKKDAGPKNGEEAKLLQKIVDKPAVQIKVVSLSG